ncbi:MAG TPA: phosphonate C-P lyase system protein PhnG [Candidatus Obscuribacterales bacterium]
MTHAVQPTGRAVWLATLAKAPLEQLEACFATLGTIPPYEFLRSPEVGLTMVRGRVEGTGQPFNLGEMTLTRCVVQMADPAGLTIAGFGYVAGRSSRHAELAAVCDALLQHPDWAAVVGDRVLTPLQAAARARQAEVAAQGEATRVNFFTLRRGESA